MGGRNCIYISRYGKLEVDFLERGKSEGAFINGFYCRKCDIGYVTEELMDEIYDVHERKHKNQ